MLVISGPSGCGKSTICRRLLEDPRVVFSVSATTRTPRKGEVDGVDYHFMDTEEFKRRIAAGGFIEWAEVHGNLYGTPREPMEEALAAGLVYLVEIDVQGGAQLKLLELPGVYLFIAPPSLEELRARLEHRGTDAPDVIERRMSKATEEMRARERYDHVVINDDFETALAEVRALAGLAPGEPGA
jgi:guanylate kinase